MISSPPPDRFHCNLYKLPRCQYAHSHINQPTTHSLWLVLTSVVHASSFAYPQLLCPQEISVSLLFKLPKAKPMAARNEREQYASESAASNTTDDSDNVDDEQLRYKEAERHLRTAMFEKQKAAIVKAAQDEIADHKRYSNFDIAQQLTTFDDESEDNRTAQDLELLGISS